MHHPYMKREKRINRCASLYCVVLWMFVFFLLLLLSTFYIVCFWADLLLKFCWYVCLLSAHRKDVIESVLWHAFDYFFSYILFLLSSFGVSFGGVLYINRIWGHKNEVNTLARFKASVSFFISKITCGTKWKFFFSSFIALCECFFFFFDFFFCISRNGQTTSE